MTLKYDVVVAGSGPAGAAAAFRASQNGASVLLVEKRKEIGYPVQCGEYFPKSHEMTDLLPNNKHTEIINNISPKMIDLKTRDLAVISPTGKEYFFNLDAYVIDRQKFDQKLADNAIKHGADVKVNTRAKNISNNGKSLIIDDGEKIQNVETDVLIAADGALSRIGKSQGFDILESAYNYSPVVQFLMTNLDIDSSIVEMYFGREYCPGGYAWIIPKGDGIANVGIGIRRPFADKGVTISDYLNRFINKHPSTKKKLKNAKILSRVGGNVPVNGAIPRSYSENIMLVGDAAGQVMASNGGGIPLATIGGEIAGEVAAKKVKNGVNLSLYEKTWKKEMGAELKESGIIRELADKAMMRDDMTEKLMEILGEKRIDLMIRGKLPFSINYGVKLYDKIKEALEK